MKTNYFVFNENLVRAFSDWFSFQRTRVFWIARVSGGGKGDYHLMVTEWIVGSFETNP